jgi:hypothetical protein
MDFVLFAAKRRRARFAKNVWPKPKRPFPAASIASLAPNTLNPLQSIQDTRQSELTGWHFLITTRLQKN